MLNNIMIIIKKKKKKKKKKKTKKKKGWVSNWRGGPDSSTEVFLTRSSNAFGSLEVNLIHHTMAHPGIAQLFQYI